MRNIALFLTYLGTRYHGWQVQKNLPTVAETVEKAASQIVGHSVHVTGCGRTDAGVHALGQVVSFDLETSIPTEKIPYAVNVFLPSGVRILACEEADSDFNARFDAKRKTYLYKMYVSPHLSPLRANSAVWLTKMPDVELMKKAAKYIVGTHDFTAFAATGSTVKDFVRTVYDLTVKREGNDILLEITGNGFLYNMVRIVVGTLLDVGYGKYPPEFVSEIIQKRDRTLAGKTMPPEGLYLKSVVYGGD